MIFRRRQDEMEGFRRMREALRQQADPQDHALLDDDQYTLYDEDDDGSAELVVAEDTVEEVAATMSENDAMPVVEDAAPPEMPALVAMPQVAAPAPAPFMRPETGQSMTMIGSDATWSGTLRSESDVYLEGHVDGTLEVKNTVYIADQAVVDARITARSVVVAGQVSGTIKCDGRLEVTPTGRVNAEIEVGSLVVHEGAVIDGKFTMKNAVAGPAR